MSCRKSRFLYGLTLSSIFLFASLSNANPTFNREIFNRDAIQKVEKTIDSVQKEVSPSSPHHEKLFKLQQRISAIKHSIATKQSRFKAYPSIYELDHTIGRFGTGKGFFQGPAGIASDGTYLYIADAINQRVIRYDLITRTFFQFGDLPSNVDPLDSPYGITYFGTDSVLVADQGTNRICEYTHDGEYKTNIGQLGISDAQFDKPMGISVDSVGTVFVCDQDNHRIQVFRLQSNQLSFERSFTDSALEEPIDCMITKTGKLWVSTDHQLFCFDASGQLINKYDFSGNNVKFSGLFVSDAGLVFVVDQAQARVLVFNQDALIISVISKGLTMPEDVAVIDQFMFVSDADKHQIVVYKKTKDVNK